MRRADRLFEIIQRLRGGRLVTAAALAEGLEVSIRTVYRDIVDLQASGVPIEGAAGVGYVLRDGYQVPPLMFSLGEIEALVVGARLAQAWGGAELARSAEEALFKIDAVLPRGLKGRAEAVRVFAPDHKLAPEVKAALDRVREAVRERRRLSFDYRRADGAEGRRTARPLGMHFWGGVWTVAAWCEARADFRTFHIDRMSILERGPVFPFERGRELQDFVALNEARRQAEGW